MNNYHATILDYLDWRGDIPFSADPFNEADNLILAQMAYVDLDGILPEAAENSLEALEGFPLEQVSKLYFQKYTREEILARSSFTRLAPVLMEKAAGTARFGGIRVRSYIKTLEKERDEQFGAVTFLIGDGSIYIAFRGTDNSIVGWKEDFKLACEKSTSGQKHAASYLEKEALRHNGTIRVGGHSKGGNLAVYAAAAAAPQIRQKIAAVYSNDGPGFLPEVTGSEGYKDILPRIRSYVPEYSVFGLLMNSGVPHIVIKSLESGIMQHDAMSWEVTRSGFERGGELSDFSMMVDKTINGWLGEIDQPRREEFIETIFGVLDATGADTFTQLNQNKFRNYTEIAKTVFSMEKEKRDQALDVISLLLKSGRNVLGAEIRERTQGDEKAPAEEQTEG